MDARLTIALDQGRALWICYSYTRSLPAIMGTSMALSRKDISLIQSSFDRMNANIEPHSLFFYESLFAHAPQFRVMFREDLAGQGMKFMSTLATILENLHSPDAIEDRYVELGEAHARLGVKATDFKPMEDALIDTMRNALGPDFTSELEAAWRTAFAEFSGRMIEKGQIPKK